MGSEFLVTEELQAQLLACMLGDSQFAEVARDHLEPEMFTNRALQWFFDKISQAPIQLSPATLCEELIKAKRDKIIRAEEAPKYLHLYEMVKSLPLPHEQDYIRAQLSTFMRTQAVKRAFESGYEFAKNQQWEDLAATMQDAVQVGLDLNDLGTDYFGDFERRINERPLRERSRRIATGIPELDELTNGGIKNKQVGLIAGATGRGKSIFLSWLARTAVMLGKKVVYITCELSEDEIADRFDAMLAHVKVHELNEFQQQLLASLGTAAQTYGSSLWIKHYPADTATVTTLKAYVRQLTSAGVRPDMVIVDYLDLLKPHRTYNSQYLETDAITKALVGFAHEFDFALYTATQLNRAGMSMETPDGSALAGYVGKQFHVDMMFVMAQKREEKEDQEIRLNIEKNRNGIAGRVIKLDTDYSYMTFYKERMDAEEGTVDNEEDSTHNQGDDGSTGSNHGLGDRLQLLLEHSSEDGSDST